MSQTGIRLRQTVVIASFILGLIGAATGCAYLFILSRLGTGIDKVAKRAGV